MTISQTRWFYIFLIISSSLVFYLSEKVSVGVINIKVKKEDEGGRKICLSKIIGIISSYLILLVPLVNRTCGSDTEVYYFDYTSERMYNFDVTFFYMLRVLHRMIPRAKIGLGIVSGLTLALIFAAIIIVKDKVESPLVFFAFTTILYFNMYNYMRIMLAVAFVVLGYSMIIIDRKKTAMVLFAIAGLMHLSTIIVLPIYVATIVFKKYKQLIIMIGAMLFLIFVINPTFFFSFIRSERYLSYLSFDSDDISVSFGLGTIVRILPVLFVILIFLRKYSTDERYIVMLIFTFANIAFSFLGYYVGVLSRLSIMLLVFHQMYAIPYIVANETNGQNRQVLRWIQVAYCSMLYYILSLNFEAMMIVPYC